jgi:AhpD family alkylhydroperoxidase
VTKDHEEFKPLKVAAKKAEPIPESIREAAPCCASSPSDAPSNITPPVPSSLDGAFAQYMASVMAPGAMGAKQKKLTALALSVATKCGPCIRIHLQGLRTVGANDSEISEAVALGIAFGGASAAMFYKTIISGGKE